MTIRPYRTASIVAGLLAAWLLTACNARVNDDVIIPAGADRSGGAASINGDIVVGEDASSKGNLKSVNGSIRVKDGAEVKNIASVNGAITVGQRARTGSIEGVNGTTDCEQDARIDGNIKLVNGAVRLKTGATITGDVKTVNGPIHLIGATVEGNVNNYNGGIVITDNSLVKGSVTVSRPGGGELGKPPVVIVGPGSTVVGAMRFERPVRLYVHDGAEVGEIEGADPVAFSGAELPEDG